MFVVFSVVCLFVSRVCRCYACRLTDMSIFFDTPGTPGVMSTVQCSETNFGYLDHCELAREAAYYVVNVFL